MYQPLSARDVLDVNLAALPPWTGAPGQQGEFNLIVNDPLRLDLARPPATGGGVGFLVLALLALGGAVAQVPLAALMGSWVYPAIVGLPLLHGALLALAAARVRLRSVHLTHDVATQTVTGTPVQDRGGWWPLLAPGRAVFPAAQAEAVVLEVVPWRAIRGGGATSRARLRVAGPGVLLEGPSTPEGPYPEWARARAALLPLGVALARRLKCPLRVQLREAGGPPQARDVTL